LFQNLFLKASNVFFQKYPASGEFLSKIILFVSKLFSVFSVAIAVFVISKNPDLCFLIMFVQGK